MHVVRRVSILSYIYVTDMARVPACRIIDARSSGNASDYTSKNTRDIYPSTKNDNK